MIEILVLIGFIWALSTLSDLKLAQKQLRTALDEANAKLDRLLQHEGRREDGGGPPAG